MNSKVANLDTKVTKAKWKLECHSKIDVLNDNVETQSVRALRHGLHDCSTVSLNHGSQRFLSGAKASDKAWASLRNDDSDE